MAPTAADNSKGKSPSNPTQDLIKSAQSLDTLLERFESTISSIKDIPATNVPSDAPDPLDIVHDAAKLLKAHTTKLSLFMINKPFTPSTIQQCIQEIGGTVAPAIMGAIEICQPAKYTRVLHLELRRKTTMAFNELRSMMKEVIAQAPAAGTASTESKGQLPSTGVLWKTCDELMAVKLVGLAGVVTAKAKEYQGLIADALSELKDWVENVEDEGFEEAEEAQSDDEDDFGTEQKLPADRKDLKATAEQAIKRLRYLESLYKAIVKQRLAKFESSPENIARLDDLMADLSQLPSEVDDIAFMLYNLDDDEARDASDAVLRKAKTAIESASLSWKGEADEFTAWSNKWLELVDKT